jgi:hypothetical protein
LAGVLHFVSELRPCTPVQAECLGFLVHEHREGGDFTPRSGGGATPFAIIAAQRGESECCGG